MRFLVLCALFVPFVCFSQVSDTLYVDEVDTVVVVQKPVIVTKSFYEVQQPSRSNKKHVSLSATVALLKDYGYYFVCESCKENFNLLKSSSKATHTLQLGLQADYLFKRMSIGVQLNYRTAQKAIDYNNDSTIQIKNTTTVTYFMIGPSLGYKILKRKKWDMDIYAAVNFSYTLSQSGLTVGGNQTDTKIDLSSEPLYTSKNLLYHCAPTVTYKITPSIGVAFSIPYYFDAQSNVNKNQSYIEQRNSVGVSLGINYLL